MSQHRLDLSTGAGARARIAHVDSTLRSGLGSFASETSLLLGGQLLGVVVGCFRVGIATPRLAVCWLESWLARRLFEAQIQAKVARMAEGRV